MKSRGNSRRRHQEEEEGLPQADESRRHSSSVAAAARTHLVLQEWVCEKTEGRIHEERVIEKKKRSSELELPIASSDLNTKA